MPNVNEKPVFNVGDFCTTTLDNGVVLVQIRAIDGEQATVQQVNGKGLPVGEEQTRPITDLSPLDTVPHTPDWIGAYAESLEQTGSPEAAIAAARGLAVKNNYIGVKALDNDTAIVSGWALIFTDEQHPDLKDTFFDPETTPKTLMLDYYQNAPLFIDHGRDLTQLWRPVGHRVNTKLYPRGVWLEHELSRSLFAQPQQYDRVLNDIQSGRYAYSSDSIEHMAIAGFDPSDGALEIWPMVGCSITQNPAEPALGPISLGSFVDAMKSAAEKYSPAQEREQGKFSGGSNATSASSGTSRERYDALYASKNPVNKAGSTPQKLAFANPRDDPPQQYTPQHAVVMDPPDRHGMSLEPHTPPPIAPVIDRVTSDPHFNEHADRNKTTKITPGLSRPHYDQEPTPLSTKDGLIEITEIPVADSVDTPRPLTNQDNGVTTMADQLDKLAEFLGLPDGSNPDDVAAAVEDYINSANEQGSYPPDFMDAMGLPPGTAPDQAGAALRDHCAKCTAARNAPPQSNISPVTAGAMSADAGSFSIAQPEQPIAPPRNYGSLKESHLLGQKSVTRPMPFAVSDRANGPREYATKSVNFNRNEPYLPFAYTFHDMVMATKGQQRGFKSSGFGAKAMSYSSGPAGGYILEQEISDQVLDPLRAEAVIFKAGARQEDLDGVQVKTIPAMLTAPAAYWPGEANAVTTSQPVYRLITLVPKPLAVLVQRPFNFFKNMTPNSESQLRAQIIKSMMLEIDRVTLIGEGGSGSSGTGNRPLGLLNIPGVPTVQLGATDPTVNPNGRAPTLKDLVAADGSLDDANIPEGGKRGWIFNARSKRAFTGMTDTFSRPLLRESWGSADPDRELLGYSYFVENQISNTLTVGTNTDTSQIFFADWQYVVVGLTTRVELVLDQTYAAQLLQGLLAYVYVDVVIEYPQAAYVMTGVRGA